MFFKPLFNPFRAQKPIRNKRPKQQRLLLEQLEIRDVPTAYGPGNLVVTQLGDTGNTYTDQATFYLNEYTTTPGAALVQQTAVANNQAVGGTGNQPITQNLTAAAGNGLLTRTYDGTGLVFSGVDSGINNGAYILPQTPTGSANRVIAITGNDPASATFINTTTYGPFYIGDDSRTGVAETQTGPVYGFGHPNQAGGAVSQGVLYFPTVLNPGDPSVVAQSGTQISAGANIRGGIIGFDNRLYWSTAGSTSTGLAGIYTANQALPDGTQGSPPAADVPVVKALFAASKLGGVYLADVNGIGIISNGDRIYFNDDGTVGGAGTGGLYMSMYDTTRYGGANAVPGQAPGWSPAIRLGEGIIAGQPNPQVTAQLRGLTGTVLSATDVSLYASQFDNFAGNNSYILNFEDTTPGVLTVMQASEVGNLVTIKAKELVTGTVPAGFTAGAAVTVNQVSTGGGGIATTGGYNGFFTISGTPTDNGDGTFNFSYMDGNASGLATITNPPLGVTDLQVLPTIVQTLADGTDASSISNAAQGLRGVSFAPTQPTTVDTLLVNGASTVTVAPGTNVTFTVNVSNPQVSVDGLLVTFIDQTNNTIIGQGTITGGVASFTTTTPLVGNHTVAAYFAGGGTQALASANSATIVQVNEAGATASATGLAATIGGTATTQAAIGRPVTLTATITGSGATGTVSFYNGNATPANLIGNAPVSSATATVTTSFNTAGMANIIAVYNGDDTYASSTSSTVSLTIAANATAAITTSANNVVVGATPTYTATLTGSLGVVAGTVQFFLDGTQLGTPQTLDGSGAASVTSTALTAGSHLITISYTSTATSPYAALVVNTTTSASGVALIETARQALTPGNLIAVQRGDGTTNLGSSGYLVFLDEYTTGGVLVQRIALPNADAGMTNALLLSGQNGTEGLINRSADGQFLTIIGYDVPVGTQFVTSTFPFQYGRTIARIDANGNVDTSTVVNMPSTSSVPYNPSDVVSFDGTQFWLSSNLPNGDTTDSGILYTTFGSTGAATQLGPVPVGASAIGIFGTGANAQLVTAGGSEDLNAVGSGLPTTSGQTLGSFPNLEAEYSSVFSTRNPEQFVFLNTSDGSSNNPNLVYIADQANGLLKFWMDGAGQWHLGQLNTHTFGQKVIFSGGATGVVATIINPGTSSATVNIYATGSSVQQANPNQIAFFQDHNGAPAGTAGTGVDQGFSPGSFSTIAFVGGLQGQPAPDSPNGNMNFAGLAIVPGSTPGPRHGQNNQHNLAHNSPVVMPVSTGTGSVPASLTGTLLNQFYTGGLAQGSITLPTAVSTVTIQGTSLASIADAGVTPIANNSTLTSASVVDSTHITYTTSTNSPATTVLGTATDGYLTDSADGYTLSIDGLFDDSAAVATTLGWWGI
jgi:hypothetical protein